MKATDVSQVLLAEERHLRRRRSMLALVLVLVAVAAGLGGWWWYGQSQRPLAAQYMTEAAQRADIRVVVVATGSLQPRGEAAVTSTIGGVVIGVDAGPNTLVTAGQVLARLDMVDVEAHLRAAEAREASQRANLQIAETNLADAQADLARAEALSAGENVSMRALDMAGTAVARAQAQRALAQGQLQAAQADAAAARHDVENACICSPIAGVVLEANVTLGQAIAASGLGQPLFRVAEDLARLDLEVNIDEADIGSVSEGDLASFVVEAWPRRSFAGTIRQIRFAPSTVDGVVSYLALIDVDNAQMLLRPGMTATADIVVDEVFDVLSIADAALRFSPAPQANGSLFGGLMPSSTLPGEAAQEQTVWVLRNGALTQVKVQLGLSDGRRSQLVGGALEEGEPVVIGTAAP